MLLQPPLLMSTTKLGFLIACLAYRAIASRLDLGLYPCPVDCDDELKSWTIYTDAKRLGNCNRPMLLDFGIHNSQAGSSDPVEVRACMVNSAIRSTESRPRKHESTISSRHVAGSPDLCVANATAASTALDVGMAGNGSEFTWAALDALVNMRGYMSVSCDLKNTFSYGAGPLLGVFSGAAIDNTGTVWSIFTKAIDLVNRTTGAPETMFVQRCIVEESSAYTFGIAMDTAGNLTWVQQAVNSWDMGLCLNSTSDFVSTTVHNATIFEYSHPAVTLSNITSITDVTDGSSNSGCSTIIDSRYSLIKPRTKWLADQGDCITKTVASGDTCSSLATKCGISNDDFMKYNNGSNSDLCSTLVPGQRVCCSEGPLPDIRPKENSNGTCFAVGQD